mgnify:CR=1 FL=1
MGRDTQASRREGGAGVEPSRSPGSPLTVEQLERVRTRDPEALGALVDAYSGRIFGLDIRMTGDRAAAEDVTQETFLKVHRAAHQLDATRDPGPWLLTLSLIHISEPTRLRRKSRMPSSA